MAAKGRGELRKNCLPQKLFRRRNASAVFCLSIYPGVKVTRAMIIPTKRVGKAAGFNEEVFIIRASGLAKIVRSVRRFFEEFASLDLKDLSEQKVQELIDAHDLSVNAVGSNYLEKSIA